MPASRKKIVEHDIFGPKPLPSHFGEIDVTAPFDAKRFYTVLRCAGMNPIVTRQNGPVSVSMEIWREQTALQKKRTTAAYVWAATKDRDRRTRAAYVRETLADREYKFLGC